MHIDQQLLLNLKKHAWEGFVFLLHRCIRTCYKKKYLVQWGCSNVLPFFILIMITSLENYISSFTTNWHQLGACLNTLQCFQLSQWSCRSKQVCWWGEGGHYTSNCSCPHWYQCHAQGCIFVSNFPRAVFSSTDFNLAHSLFLNEIGPKLTF